MHRYSITGTIYNVEHSDLHAALQPYLGELEGKVRIFGYDMRHNSKTLEFEVTTTENDGSIYYLDATFRGAEDAFLSWIEGLTKCLCEADILYLLEHVEIDESDEELGEEVSHAHPGFEERFVPPKQ